MFTDRIPETYERSLRELFSSVKTICISGHHNPDGDAIGSALGLYITLKNAGYDTSVIMPTGAADFLQWLPYAEDILIYEDDKIGGDELLLSSDLLICVDFNEANRAGDAEGSILNSSAVKIMIDHHPGPGDFADYMFSFTDYSSAAEIVYEFIRFTGLIEFFDTDAATCIYTGIMTDTINFSVNSSNERTFRNIAELLSHNINKELIYEKVYNNFSPERLKLVGYLLHEKMIFLKEYGFAYIILTKNEMQRFKFEEGDHEGIVNMPLSVKGINMSLMAMELDGFMKISLRSKFDVDVNIFAREYFNGGGHKNASGGKAFTNVDKIDDYIITAVKKFFLNN